MLIKPLVKRFFNTTIDLKAPVILIRCCQVNEVLNGKPAELAHIDTHHLAKGIINGDNIRYYLLGVIDRCTRLAWFNLIGDI
jgi:hypothetical protein